MKQIFFGLDSTKRTEHGIQRTDYIPSFCPAAEYIHSNKKVFNSYKPGVLFMGHRQTA